jgi:hypothetical protein
VPFLLVVNASEPVSSQGDLVKLTPLLEQAGQVSLRALVANSGTTHFTSLGGTADVLKADGSLVGRIDFPPSTAILPGTLEVLAGTNALPLTEGTTYRLKGTLKLSNGPLLDLESSFGATVGLEIRDLAVREVEPGRYHSTAMLANTGNLALEPRVQLDLLGMDQQRVTGTAPVPAGLVLPGETVPFAIELPSRIPRTEYVAEARAFYGAATPARSQVRFENGAAPSLPSFTGDFDGAGRAIERMPESGGLSALTAPLVATIVSIAALAWLPMLAPLRRKLYRAAVALRHGS